MSNESKVTLSAVVVALVIAVSSLFRSAPLPPPAPQITVQVPQQAPAQVTVQPQVNVPQAIDDKSGLLGGYVHNQQETFDAGLAVNGTEAISSLRGGSFTTLGASGTSTLFRTVFGGVVTSLTGVATSSLTAAQVCDSSVLKITPVSTTPTLTLPSTSTLFVAASGGCLTSNGQYADLHYQALTTSTILAAGTGGTLLTNASATVALNKGAFIRFIRDSATTYLAFMVNED